jgi:hypothetical protein
MIGKAYFLANGRPGPIMAGREMNAGQERVCEAFKHNPGRELRGARNFLLFRS